MPRRRPTTVFLRPLALSVLLALNGAILPTAQAQTGTFQSYDLPAAPLAATLNRIGRDAGLALTVDSTLVGNRQAAPVRGRLSPEQALHAALSGSGLELVRSDAGTYTLRKAPASFPGEATLAPVTVTAGTERENAWGPVKGYVAERSATGTKTDTPIVETPQSISVVTAERIEAMGATRLTEALAYTPGVSLNGGYDSRYDWLNLRGFDSISPGFYLDGMQLRNNASYTSWRTEPYATERIEVLRGPTSVLYGQNSPGGTVNVVSKRPTAEALREVKAQVGNYGRREIAGDFSGPLDEDGKLLYRITGLTMKSDTQVDHVGDDRAFIAPALTWRPSGDTSLTVLGHLYRIRGASSVAFLPNRGTLLDSPEGRISTSTFVGEPDIDRFDQDQWAIGYLFEHRFDDVWSVRQNLRYGGINTDYWQVYAGSYLVGSTRQIRRYLYGAVEKGKLLTVDNQLEAKLHSGDWQHTVLLGVDYQRGRFDVRNYWNTAPSIDIYAPVYGQPVTIPDPMVDSRTTLAQSGFYIQDQIKWGRHWAATLGGRYDRATVDSIDHLADSRSKQTDGKFSGRAGLVYLADNGLAPYLSYAESFSPLTTINPATNKPFDPETGKQYEIGLRYQPPGRNASYNAAIFDLRRQNVMTFSKVYVPEQVGEVRVKGLELEATVQPMRNLNVVAAYSWTPSAKVTQSNNPDQVGKQLQAVSEHQLALWSDYRFPGGVKIGLGIRHVSSNHGYGEGAPTKVAGYTLFDTLLGYDFGRWKLALNVHNLADKVYLGNNCDTTSCGYGERRRILGSVTYRW